MKKILMLIGLIGAFVGTADAKKKGIQSVTDQRTEVAPENSLAWKAMSVGAEDLREFLELKNMYIYKYDLSGVRDTTLEVIVQLDEYFGRDSLRTVRLMTLGRVYGHWDSTYLKAFKLQFVPKSDSTMLLFCDLEGRGATSMLFKKRKAAPNFDFYATYLPKPFKTTELKVNQTVPIMLFGSYWYDEKLSKRYGGWPFYRFCMEDEMDEDMHSEAFDNMPHYWIIRIGLQERRD